MHNDVVEDDVWHIMNYMLDLNDWESYCMNFSIFEYLVSELTVFLLLAPTIVRDFVFICKQIKLMIFHLAQGMSPKIMKNFIIVESLLLESTPVLYVMFCLIAMDCFVHSTYIHTSIGSRLEEIIEKFRKLMSLQNVASAIDGTPIPLAQWPNKYATPMPGDFFNRKIS